MSEPLPYNDFQWVSADECEKIDWRAQLDYQEYGYFVECDLQYPDNLHNAHNEYQLAPERVLVEDRLLSETQLGLREKYLISHSVSAKLIPNFFPKKEQLMHYRNLKYYLEHGLVLTKVHKAIRFKQARWLQPYIQGNTDRRAMSIDAAIVELYKFLNNSTYGKMIENLLKRIIIKLVNSRIACEKLINKPHCKRFQVFTGDLAAIEMQQVKCLINKPTYSGFAVLELSKLHMYKFHYDQMRTWYPSSELLFTDTDSLMYQVYTEDLYTELSTRREFFDFSNYRTDHPLYGLENKMVLGKMKDESHGEIITEFVGLRPKMYSYTTLQDDAKLKESKRAKGIQRAAIRAVTHADYLTQLRAPDENYVNIRRIGQKHHRLFTMSSLKRGLCAFDDKRYLLPCGIRTIAHGHHMIRDQQQSESGDKDQDMTTVPVVDESGELVENFITLSAQQAQHSNIRVTTHAESLDMLTGVDLRKTLSHASIRRASVIPVNTLATPAKRAHFECDEEDEVDENLALIDEAAQFFSLNGAF
jgi:hypothetical protein